MGTRSKRHFVLYLCIAAIIFFMIYNIYNNQNNINNVKAKNNEQEAQLSESKEAIAVDIAKIKPSTKLIYEYYYTDNGEIKREEELAPYFLLDMSREDLNKKFPDWRLQSFSEDQVVIRKNIDIKNQEKYIIGIYKGYVAVFFEQPVNGETLRELTNTPVESLNPQDRAKLEAGIRITGIEALISALEDYES